MSRPRDPSLIPDAMPVGGLTVGQLRSLLQAAAQAIRDAERSELETDATGLSLYRAARLAHRRAADVRSALRTGALPGHNRGKRWIIAVSAIRDWVKAGCPCVPESFNATVMVRK